MLRLTARSMPGNSPLATLTKHSGDCEDYAILKFAALLEAGVSSEDLRVVVVHDTARSEDHGVVAVRHEGEWLILDNRRLLMLADTQLANYSPLLQLDGAGARRYLDVSRAPDQDTGPSAVVAPSAIAR